MAVEKKEPAVDWLLKKYEESVDLSSAPGKRKYSDVALRLLKYVKDEVERASYEEKVAKKLGVDVAVLKEKNNRLNEKISRTTKYMKKPKTEVKDDRVKRLENSLLAIKIFGGVTKVQIPIEIPEDETKLAELELVFNSERKAVDAVILEKEARELLKQYDAEVKKVKIEKLNKELAKLDEEDGRYEEIIREIRDLQKT